MENLSHDWLVIVGLRRIPVLINSLLVTYTHPSAASGLPSLGDSVLFDDDWFGDYSPDNQLHTVTKGRWAYLKIMNVSRAHYTPQPPRECLEQRLLFNVIPTRFGSRGA